MKLLLPLIACIISAQAIAQFKNDNVLYRTVDPAELCKALRKNKEYLLLDVRSKGEHHDTSSLAALNLGHLKGATNIDINELGKRINELALFKDKPVFVYCSHSQRSRRAGKMLADSGFTKVYNINGGLTAFHYKALKDDDCISRLYETANNYAIISFNQLCKKVEKDRSPFILDVRPDSAFRHISLDAKQNALGTIRGSINIPYKDLQTKLDQVPKNAREIIIIDMSGADAAKAAVLLKQRGYPNVSILIEGIDRILATDSKELMCKDKLYESPVAFKTVNAVEFGRYAKANSNFMLLDVRSKEEFENKHTDAFRNIGRLHNAINVPANELETRLSEINKDKLIIVYGYSSGNEVYRAATLLHQKGFPKVTLLVGGIFNMRWSSGNVKGQEYLRDMVVDVPEANQ